MNQLPTLKSWLVCQVDRDDEVGTLARTYLEEARDFDDWIEQAEKSEKLTKALARAQSEYNLSVENLRKGEYSETFPFAMTLPGFEELTERSRKVHTENPDVTAREYLDLLRENSYKKWRFAVSCGVQRR